MNSCTVIKESATYCLSVPLFVQFSFSLDNKIFYYRFLSFFFRQGLYILYTWWGQPNVLLKTKPRCWDLFLPSFSIFPISHSYVMNIEFFVKDFSGTTWPRILNLVQTSDMTSCTVYRKFSHILLISPFICPFFSLSNLSGMTSDGYRRGMWALLTFCYISWTLKIWALRMIIWNYIWVIDPELQHTEVSKGSTSCTQLALRFLT